MQIARRYVADEGNSGSYDPDDGALAAAREFGEARDQQGGASTLNPALQQALYHPGAGQDSSLLTEAGIEAAPRVPSISAANELRRSPEQARPSSTRMEDLAAQLTAKSAESEANYFWDFLHRPWAGAPDSPVYYVESSKGQSEDVRGFDRASHIHACVKEGLNHTKKPLHGNPDDQLRNETNPNG